MKWLAPSGSARSSSTTATSVSVAPGGRMSEPSARNWGSSVVAGNPAKAACASAHPESVAWNGLSSSKSLEFGTETTSFTPRSASSRNAASAARVGEVLEALEADERVERLRRLL